MADGSWNVHISFRYYRYTDAHGRSLELQRDPSGTGGRALIYVPTPCRWPSVMPEWATDRNTILERIREATAHMDDEWCDC